MNDKGEMGMENEKLLGEQIVVFSWMGSTFAAFDLFFSPDLRLRINKKSFWRILLFWHS